MHTTQSRSGYFLKSLLAGSVMLTVAACSSSGGSSSSDNSLRNSLQGQWQAECETLTSELSVRESLSFEGSTIERSAVFYVASDNCSNGLIFTVVGDSSFTLPEGTTDTAAGIAQHIDIITDSVVASSTQTLDAQLALENITFDELLQSLLGVSTSSETDPAAFGVDTPVFSLILVNEDTLNFADDDSNDGTSPETRYTEIGQEVGDVFTRS